MLLADLSGIAYAKIIGFYENEATPPIEDVRRVLIRELQEYQILHLASFGRMIVCADSKPYWRTQIQPSYKMNRIKARESSTINSEQFYADLAIIKQDIVNHTSFMMIDIETAEADDVIAVLTEVANDRQEPVLIISSDKDMLQLQLRNKKTFQFSPNRLKLLSLVNTEYDIVAHFLKGDTSDGIPNVFSPDNHFMIEGEKPRQRSITKKIKEEAYKHYPDNMRKCDFMTDEVFARYEQNVKLIDTTHTPECLAHKIIATYDVKLMHVNECGIEELLSDFDAVEDAEDNFEGVSNSVVKL